MAFGVGGPPQWPKLTGLQLPVDHKLKEAPFPASLALLAHGLRSHTIPGIFPLLLFAAVGFLI